MIISNQWDLVRRERGFALLGELFAGQTACQHLLDDVGVGLADVPAFGPLTPADWWRQVCRLVANGRFEHVDLARLLAAAADQFPASEPLRRLAGLLADADRPGAGPGRPLRILCLLAGPVGEPALRLGEELRRIMRAVDASAGRLELTVQPAARIADLLPLLRRARPDLLHFAGHGTALDGLVFEDAEGLPATLPIEALAGALAAFGRLECVLLSCCWSAGHSGVLAARSRLAIGSEAELGDRAAVEFSAGFYDALAAGSTPARAYAEAVAAVRLLGLPTDGLHRYPTEEEPE
ncbi:CHAT domain-containing protein [Kitasatospora sp. NPDC127111]|uniref:CHAT domain-containing protein n=1 Tax=Kitasatospora sp. NPDC127111 TaxID=3345363 RepID=UPI0036376F2B